MRIVEETRRRLNPNLGIYAHAYRLYKQLQWDQLEIALGLRFSRVTLPKRTLTYFYLDATADNQSSIGRIKGIVTIEGRILCVDGNKKVNVLRYTKDLALNKRGEQYASLGGGVSTATVREHNANSTKPWNWHVAIRIGNVTVYEAFLRKIGESPWWVDDSLIER